MTAVSGLSELGNNAAPEPVAARPAEGGRGEPWWHRPAYGMASLVLLLGVWELASLRSCAWVLPGPWATFQAATASNPYLWSDMGATAERIMGAFLMALGAALIL